MPTYVFDEMAAAKAVIDNQGVFAEQYLASHIYETLNVFGDLQWCLIMDGSHDDIGDGDNPFFVAWQLLWSFDGGEVGQIGMLDNARNARRWCRATLVAKFGHDRGAAYFDAMEQQHGYLHWVRTYVSPQTGAFLRINLVEDAQAGTG